MSAGVIVYLNGVVIGENQVFYGKHYLNSDGVRLAEEIVPFVNIETSDKLSTTDDTVTDISTIEIPQYTTMLISAKVVARRTGGSAGTAEDGLAYELRASFKNVAGAATQMGSTVFVFNEKDQIGWDVNFDTSGGNVLIQVTGAIDNNIDWLCQVTKHLITTIVDPMP